MDPEIEVEFPSFIKSQKPYQSQSKNCTHIKKKVKLIT